MSSFQQPKQPRTESAPNKLNAFERTTQRPAQAFWPGAGRRMTMVNPRAPWNAGYNAKRQA